MNPSIFPASGRLSANTKIDAHMPKSGIVHSVKCREFYDNRGMEYPYPTATPSVKDALKMTSQQLEELKNIQRSA